MSVCPPVRRPASPPVLPLHRPTHAITYIFRSPLPPVAAQSGVFNAPCRPVDSRSVGRSVGRLVGRSAHCRPVGRSARRVLRSVGRSDGQSVGRSAGWSVVRTVGRSVPGTVDRTVGRLVSRLGLSVGGSVDLPGRGRSVIRARVVMRGYTRCNCNAPSHPVAIDTITSHRSSPAPIADAGTLLPRWCTVTQRRLILVYIMARLTGRSGTDSGLHRA